MTDKIFPEGLRFFKPRQGAPQFVKGSLVITPNDLIAWLKANPKYLTEYEGKKQLKLDLKEGKNGLYAEVNTYQKTNSDDLNF